MRDREKRTPIDGARKGQSILDSLLEQNLMGLGIWENGASQPDQSEGCCQNPEDVNGLKIRLMENPIHVAISF